jgi:lysophospholipase L1-like esterase
MDAIIKLVRQTQPSAKIYLISLTPVSQVCSETSVYNRDSILAFNAVLKQLCREQSAYYLNVFDLLCNANGFTDTSAVMSDGIHLLAPAYASIKNYLMTRAV